MFSITPADVNMHYECHLNPIYFLSDACSWGARLGHIDLVGTAEKN